MIKTKIKPLITTVLDANESIFFPRELEFISQELFEIEYQELKARDLIPSGAFGIPDGATTYTYYEYDKVGSAMIVANHATDYKRVDVTGKKYTVDIQILGDAYGYNVDEIRAATMANRPLERMRAEAAVRALRTQEDEIAWNGNTDYNIQGFIKGPSVPEVVIPNTGTGASTLWINKTPLQILADMNLVGNAAFVQTMGVRTSNTLLMPLEQYGFISSTPMFTAGGDTTILEFFLKNNPFIQQVDWLNEMLGADNGDDMIMAYEKNPVCVRQVLPILFEQFPPQQKGLDFEIICRSKTAGVVWIKPMSAAWGSGI